MKRQLVCDACHVPGNYEIDLCSDVECIWCNALINVPFTNVLSQEKLKEETPVFEKGDIVLIDNHEHVWHNEIALVCETKPIFVRIELHGGKTWVPCSWVKKV